MNDVLALMLAGGQISEGVARHLQSRNDVMVTDLSYYGRGVCC